MDQLKQVIQALRELSIAASTIESLDEAKELATALDEIVEHLENMQS